MGIVKDEAGEDGGQEPSYKVSLKYHVCLGELESLEVFRQEHDQSALF